jgi:hypothetical protein
LLSLTGAIRANGDSSVHGSLIDLDESRVVDNFASVCRQRGVGLALR